MAREIKTHTFGGTNVFFDLTDDTAIMVNATEMGKLFGKKPDDFLRVEQTQNFIQEFSRFADMRSEKIVKVVNGGKYYGTWMHRKLALKFAGWLSPAFELWVYDVIEQILFGNAKVIRDNHQSLKVITDRIKEIDRTASVIMKERYRLTKQKEGLEESNLMALGIRLN